MEERLFAFQPGDGSPLIALTEANGFSVEAETTRGLFGGAWRIGTSQLPGVPGLQVDSVARDASRPQLGLLVRARSQADFEQRIRGLVSVMMPSRGEGRLLITPVRTGITRQLPCYPTGEGLEGSEEDDVLMPGRWWKCIVKMLAPGGAFLGPAVTHEWSLTPPPRRPWFGRLKARISSRTVGGRRLLLNPGDDPVSAPWVVTGPGRELALIHHGLGKEFRLVHDIPASGPGSVITIDMTKGSQRVADGYAAPGTSNLWAKVTSDPEGWALQPGLNDVEVQLLGSGDLSSVATTYEPRHNGS